MQTAYGTTNIVPNDHAETAPTAPAERSANVLVVDDERVILDALATWLVADGHKVTTATSIEEAVCEQQQQPADVLIADVILGDGDGLDLLRTVAQRWPETLTVAMSGYGTIESAVNAIKAGAFEFLPKPVRMDRIRQVVRRSVEQQALLQANRSLRRVLSAPYNLDAIIGRAAGIQRAIHVIDAVADSNATVLIHGEPGTGRSLFAREVHRRSQRRARAFSEVHCAAIPEVHLESELFGHVPGAVAGALGEKNGKLAEANGGTLFLSGASRAPSGLQGKLLRVLQERRFEPLGSSKTQAADVRIVLGTDTDLERLVTDGGFRRDLYELVSVVTVYLPPLRDRLTDIPLLAEHFLRKYAHQSGRAQARFTDETLQCLQRYEWPGNVRELEDCVERAVVHSRTNEIRVDALPPAVVDAGRSNQALFSAESSQRLTLREALTEPEKRIIKTALEANQWNRQKTAAVLDVNRTTLYKKMRRYGLLQGDARKQP